MSSSDPTDIQAQEAIREAAKRRELVARQTAADDFKWLMGSKRGRRIVWGLLEDAGVFRLSFDTNAMKMAFAEGNKNYGLRILAMIHTLCPELYPTMTKENQHDRHADDGRRNDH